MRGKAADAARGSRGQRLAKADAAGEPAIDLARAVSDEERAIATLEDEIQHIDIVITF